MKTSVIKPLEDSDSRVNVQSSGIALSQHGAGETATINGQLAQPPSNTISIAGATLTPGASPIAVSGTPVSVGSSAIFVGSSSLPTALSPLPESDG